MPKSILIAIKPDGPAESLAKLARSVAESGAKFVLGSVVILRSESDSREVLPAVRDELSAVAETLRAAGHPTTIHVEFASVGAGTRIALLAEEVGADLIVIALTKRSRIGKALLGSDAQAVILGAPCPVLSARVGENAINA
jgi:nucleotide-binding universal stress UspA family protein